MAESKISDELKNPSNLAGISSVTVTAVVVWIVFAMQGDLNSFEKNIVHDFRELKKEVSIANDSNRRLTEEILLLKRNLLQLDDQMQRGFAEHTAVYTALDRDVKDINMVFRDPKRLPDFWGRKDAEALMDRHTSEMKRWVTQQIESALKAKK